MGDFGGFSSGFSFREADDLFRRAFGGRDPFEDFFGDNDDDFFGDFGGFGGQKKKNNKGGKQVSRDPFGFGGFGGGFRSGFDDEFFSSGFDNMGGGFSGGFQSSSFSSSGGSGMG